MINNSHDFIGKTLGSCTLEKLIGQGGMGTVYLARQTRPSRNVAIKILLPNTVMSTQVHQVFLARFRREADLIAKLEHINIMPIYEYDEQDGFAYLVMPYLQGGSLRDALIRRGSLTLGETITYINQAAAALDYAHAQGVIHRDLKPGNFLLHSDGRLVLSDFGIARIMQDDNSIFGETLTSTGMLLGTPEYMAPEMLRGEQIDYRADIYELGIVLFQMLSGQVPFKGNTPYALMIKQVQESPPLLHQINPTIPPAVNAVVQQAIAKKREDRFASAKALAQAFALAARTDGTLGTFASNAPTVLSSSPHSPVQQISISPAEPHTPAWSGGRLSSDSHSIPTQSSQPTTPTPYARPLSTQPPWFMFISVLLVIALIVGGILIGLQLNRGGINPSPAHATATPTQVQIGNIPFGTVLYSAAKPGNLCDTGGGHWEDYNSPVISCQATSTMIHNSFSNSPNLVGTLLTALPNNDPFPSDYVIEVRLQQAATSQASFGIYFRNQQGNNCGVYTFLIHDSSWSANVYDNSSCNNTEISHGTFGDAHALVTIDVVVKGANFSFYANRQLIGSINNSQYSVGTVGIAVDAGGTVSASNFTLYTVA